MPDKNSKKVAFWRHHERQVYLSLLSRSSSSFEQSQLLLVDRAQSCSSGLIYTPRNPLPTLEICTRLTHVLLGAGRDEGRVQGVREAAPRGAQRRAQPVAQLDLEFECRVATCASIGAAMCLSSFFFQKYNPHLPSPFLRQSQCTHLRIPRPPLVGGAVPRCPRSPVQTSAPVPVPVPVFALGSG